MPPLLGPVLGLVAGILCAPALDTRFALPAGVLVCLLARGRRGLMLAGIGLVGAALGGPPPPAPPSVIHDDGVARRVVMRLVEAPSPQGEAVYFLAEVLEVDGVEGSFGRARLAWFDDAYLSRDRLDSLDLGRGDTIGVLVRLSPPRSYRNPGVFDYARFLRREGIYQVGTIRSPRLIEVHTRGWRFADRIRAWTAGRIARYFPDPTIRSLVLGMTLGQRRLLPPEAAGKFEEAGLIHLLVVSGFNLAIVAGVAFAIGRRLPLGPLSRAGLTLALVAGYAFLVEGDAPVLRAALMAAWLVVGSALDRGYSVGNALAGTAMVILALDPLALRDPSFLLSFGAVTGILLIGAPLVRWTEARVAPALRELGRIEPDRYLADPVTDLRVSLRLRAERRGWPPEWVALPRRIGAFLTGVALITASVQLFLLPFAVESFHRLAPVSLGLNVIGAIVAGLVTPLGLLLVLLPDPPGSLLALALEHALGILIASVDLGLALPGATLRIGSIPLALWAVFVLGLALLGVGARKRTGPIFASGLLVVFGAVLAMVVGDFSESPPPYPVITFLDVGQGDSILVELPGGERVVIDGGGLVSGEESGGFRVGEDVVSHYLFGRRFRRIDTLVLTHAHHDHMDGLFDLVRNFEIGEIWLGPNPMLPRYRELVEAVFARGIPIRQVRAGDRRGPFEVLAPARERRTGPEVRNDDSLVLLLRWGGRTALFTGDLESDLRIPLDRVDVLKVPHHGSANTRLTIRGDLPVISVGARNRFGHPAPSRLPALRTDLLGAIRIELRPRAPQVDFPGLR